MPVPPPTAAAILARVEQTSSAQPAVLRSTRHVGDRVGDALLFGLTAAASAFTVVLVGVLAYKVVDQAWPAITKFGLGFVIDRVWNPVLNQFGALDFVYGTALTSFGAILIAAPLSIAIALFLTELAPRALRGLIGTLVETLAAVPSVVLGLWGILVLGPFVQDHLGPFLDRTLGFLPLFGGKPQLTGYLPAIIVLTIMCVPIIASISRELFLTVPPDLKEGALALGSTRWEMVRGVMMPYVGGGLVAAVILGLGRAIGEAIAVTQVIGGQTGIHISLFTDGDTLASRIAAQYQGAATSIQIASIVYLAAILLVFSLVANFAALLIVRRSERRIRGLG